MSSRTDAVQIGPYRIVRQLGAGGWSTVFEVESAEGYRLALKRLSAELTPVTQARFRREVECLRRIQHPGVLHLVDAGLDDGAPYLVTPLVNGTSLRQLLTRGPVGVEAALAIGVAAADAVAAIHAGGLVHRDLKPEHLIVTPEGNVVVIDLGLAIGPEHSRHTAEDTLTGSVPYMSPEQIDDRAPSPASDVWALGVILYEAIAGRRPFERARQSEEVAAILSGRHTPLDDLTAMSPPALARLVASCLAPAPSQRPADGAALAAALTAQVDWTSPDRLVEDRTALVREPDAFLARTRERRVGLAVQAAERALASGDRFAATREVERGLAYAPESPPLRGLIEKLMSGPLRVAQTVRGHAAPRPSLSPVPVPVPVPDSASAAPSLVPSPLASGSPSLTPSPLSRPRWPWLVGAGALGATLAIIAAATRSGDDRAAATASSGSTPSARAAEVIPGRPDPLTGIDPTPGIDEAALLGGIPDRVLSSRPANVTATKPAHVKPSRPAPGRLPAAPP